MTPAVIAAEWTLKALLAFQFVSRECRARGLSRSPKLSGQSMRTGSAQDTIVSGLSALPILQGGD
jgi:hypothetical protein